MSSQRSRGRVVGGVGGAGGVGGVGGVGAVGAVGSAVGVCGGRSSSKQIQPCRVAACFGNLLFDGGSSSYAATARDVVGGGGGGSGGGSGHGRRGHATQARGGGRYVQMGGRWTGGQPSSGGVTKTGGGHTSPGQWSGCVHAC